MKVLHIGKYYPPYAGGMEHFLSDLHCSLNKFGVKSSILVHQHESFKQITETVQENIYQVPILGTMMYTPVCPLFPFALNKIVKKIKPDILHIHMPNISAFWIMGLSCTRHIPWIIHWHSDVVPSDIDKRMIIAYKFYKPFEYHLLKHAKEIIVTSEPYLETSHPLSLWKDKCQVVPLGLDPLRFKQSNTQIKHLWGESKYKVLAIGRLTYYKGHDFLIRAASHLPDFKILIVGEGEKREGLQKLINKLGVSKRVKLVGFLKKQDLHTLLSTCDCLCLPSVERTEAFGLVILEAMCFAKPVVASNISGPAWIIKHKKTGMLVHPGNAKSLAEALKYIMEYPGLKNQMGADAIERFNHMFRIDIIAKKIINIYSKYCHDGIEK
ncbi:glycosyl transferase family 1 [Candidatus Magnetomorum sp. HK-1]|nr:glycosyl transferase family 1 [Candidatus Magnetomorum sp. HK-1]